MSHARNVYDDVARLIAEGVCRQWALGRGCDRHPDWCKIMQCSARHPWELLPRNRCRREGCDGRRRWCFHGDQPGWKAYNAALAELPPAELRARFPVFHAALDVAFAERAEMVAAGAAPGPALLLRPPPAAGWPAPAAGTAQAEEQEPDAEARR
jgi:hypothetical protein